MNWGWGEIFWMKRADGSQAEHIKTETERQIKGVQAWLEERIEPSGWLTGPEFGLVDAGCGPDRAWFGVKESIRIDDDLPQVYHLLAASKRDGMTSGNGPFPISHASRR
jgi:glutathione S-transferase